MVRFRRMLCSALAAALTVSLATAAASAAYGSGTVNAGPLRLRAEPSTSSAVLASAPRGASVEVLGEAGNGWYQVSYAGKTGYMSGEFLDVVAAPVEDDPAPLSDEPVAEEPDEPDDASDAEEAEELRALVLASPSLNVRTGPGLGYARIASLRCGTVVDVVEQGDEWSQIRSGSVSGYVCSEFVLFLSQEELDDASALGVQAVDLAREFLGYPYVYGGASPASGFDCSGLISYVFKTLDHPIARTGTAQWNSLPHVDGDLQTGDIVCFTRTYNSSNYISHVGLYIGGGKFIHASNPTSGVIVSSLSERYYATRYVGAVRVI